MKATLHNVQMLRFLAASMVLVSHLQHEVPSVRGLNTAGYSPWKPIWLAGGVDIFFVISGFIMYVIAADTFGKSGSARNFLMRRWVRVVPPYWLFTTAMLLAAILFKDQVAHAALSVPHIIASYLFLPWKNPYGQFYPILMLGWTLNFEMLFYFIFSLALRFSLPLGLGVIVTTISGIAICGVLFDFRDSALAFWCNPIVLEFLFGIALAFAFRQGVRWSLAGGLLSITAGFGLMVWMQYSGIAGNYWSARFLWMGLPALLVCTGAVLSEKQGEPNRIQRAMSVGGDASFVLYLSHPFSLAMVASVWPMLGIHSPVAYVVCAGIAAFAAAVVLYQWIEKPSMIYLNKVFFPKPQVLTFIAGQPISMHLPGTVKP